MSRYAVERAALLRRVFGLAGPATTGDVWRLAVWLEPAVLVRQGRVQAPMVCSRPDGGGQVVLPAGMSERAEAAALLEELAHWLCRGGLQPPVASFLSLPGHRFLHERREAAEEEEATWFSLAFALGEGEDEEEADLLVEPEELLPRLPRLRQLRAEQRRSLEISPRPPAWSSALDYRLEVRRCPLYARLRAVPRGAPERGGDYVELLIDEDRLPAAAADLYGSLLCLRPEEFLLKHRHHLVGAAEPVECDWPALLGAKGEQTAYRRGGLVGMRQSPCWED